VAAGAATGGQTGIAATLGLRKQLRSQQLQPVATADNTATADRTNSFLIICLLRTTDRGEFGRSERSAGTTAQPAGKRAFRTAAQAFANRAVG
jgi:hypothetical protein